MLSPDHGARKRPHDDQATEITPVKIIVYCTKMTPKNTLSKMTQATDTTTCSDASKYDTKVADKNTQINMSPLDIDLIMHSDKEVRDHTGLDSGLLYSAQARARRRARTRARARARLICIIFLPL